MTLCHGNAFRITMPFVVESTDQRIPHKGPVLWKIDVLLVEPEVFIDKTVALSVI